MRILFTIVAICLISTACLAGAPEGNLEKCLSGLDAVAHSIETDRQELKPNLAKGMKGLALAAAHDRGMTIDYARTKGGSIIDVKYCAGMNVAANQVELLMKAYYGYLSPNPYDDIAACYAGFMASADEVDRKLGATTSQKVGIQIGVHIGRTYSALNYLLREDPPSQHEIESEARSKLAQLNLMNATDKEHVTQSYLNICEWYGAPIGKILESAYTDR